MYLYSVLYTSYSLEDIIFLNVCSIQLLGHKDPCMLLKTTRDLGIHGSKAIKAMHLHILNISQLMCMIIGKLRKSCLLYKAKARKESGALIPTKI